MSEFVPYWVSDPHIQLTSDNVAEVVAWLQERLPDVHVEAGRRIEGVAASVGVTGIQPYPDGWRRCWEGQFFGISADSGELYVRPLMPGETAPHPNPPAPQLLQHPMIGATMINIDTMMLGEIEAALTDDKLTDDELPAQLRAAGLPELARVLGQAIHRR